MFLDTNHVKTDVKEKSIQYCTNELVLYYKHLWTSLYPECQQINSLTLTYLLSFFDFFFLLFHLFIFYIFNYLQFLFIYLNIFYLLFPIIFNICFLLSYLLFYYTFLNLFNFYISYALIINGNIYHNKFI